MGCDRDHFIDHLSGLEVTDLPSTGDRGRDTGCPVPPAQIRTGAH
jgi:hypothetical protein